ncbi:MAG TPA: universal stress protein [Acidimicrobiales bacterium]|nr:universal stress protein [Acidimicrobiales bacterium]
MTAGPVFEGAAGDDATTEHIGRAVLVVGLDGSDPSWDAFAWAAGEARRCRGRIIAVFVTPLVEPEAALSIGAPYDYEAAVEATDQIAEELAGEVARRADVLGVEASFVREKGDATHVITEVARSEHADLIAVGRSAKPLHRLAGSVSRRLVLCRDLPVTVVVP